jgi:dihydropteroate synthase
MGDRLWRLAGTDLDLSAGVLMGVLNVTPDSFSDGGLHTDPIEATAAARAMVSEGAAIIDVGGESTRPGAAAVDASEEMSRVLPVISSLAGDSTLVSIDTSKPEVASAAIEAGARIVNDVTGAAAPGMPAVLADSGVGVVIVHMKGTPRTMQVDPHYDDVVGEVGTWLSERAGVLIDAGVNPASVAVDPGIGFGKTVRHNLELIDGLPRLVEIGYPIVLGTSRKSFLGKVTGIDRPQDRDGATAVTTALGFERGARVFRVHDIASSAAALHVAAAIVSAEIWDEWSQD